MPLKIPAWTTKLVKDMDTNDLKQLRKFYNQTASHDTTAALVVELIDEYIKLRVQAWD